MSWWEYEPLDVYYNRHRLSFEEKARQQAASYLTRQSLADYGIMPDVATKTQPAPWETPDYPKVERKHGGGILGRVRDVLGDATEEIFRGPVDQPWDVFRPVQQALDWEKENVTRPATRALNEAINYTAAGLRTPIGLAEGKSLEEAFSAGLGHAREREARQPGWQKAISAFTFETALSPSTWLGPSVLGKGWKGFKLGLDAGLLEPLFGKSAIKLAAIRGGAGEPELLTTLREAVSKTTMGKDLIRESEEALAAARANPSLLNVLASHLQQGSTPRNIIELLPGGKLADTDVLIQVAQNARLRQVGVSTSNYWKQIAQHTAKSAGLSLDKDGRLLDLADQPFIEDVAKTLSKYPGLTDTQRQTIRLLARPIQLTRELASSAGTAAKARPVEVYFPTQGESTLVDIAGGVKEVGLGPEVPRGYGAIPSYRRPATFATKAEGTTAGVKYIPFWDAYGAYIEQNFNAVADRATGAALSAFGKTASELLPQALKDTHQKALNRYSWLRALDREVARYIGRPGYKAFKYPLQFDAKAFSRRVTGKMPDEVRALADELATASALGKQANRHLAFYDIREKIKPLLAASKAHRDLASSSINRFKAGLTRQSLGGPKRATAEVGSYPRFFQGRYYPEEVGAEIQQSLAPKIYGGLEGKIMKLNNNIRAVVANFDASALGIQGLLGLVSNPSGYFQALKASMFLGYEDILATAEKSGIAEAAIKSGIHIASDSAGEFIIGKELTGIPVIGKAFRTSNAWFTRFGNVMRLKMFETGYRPGMSVAAKEALARNANLATGFSPAKPTTVEQIALFAPKYFRSQLGLIADAVTRGDIAGSAARRQLISLMVLGTALVAGINEATGTKTEWNPTKSNFLRIRAFGRDISPFGPWDTLARALTVFASQGPAAGVSYLGRSKASPVLSQVYNILTSSTYTGQKLDWSSPTSIIESLATLGKQAVPMSFQQAFEQGIPTTPGQAAGSALEFLGTKATPMTDWERLAQTRDELSQKEHGVNWSELGRAAKWNLEQKYPDQLNRPEAVTDLGEYFAANRAIGDRYYSRLQELEKAVQSGQLSLPKWREQYVELRKLQAGEYSGLQLASEKVVSQLDTEAPKDANLRALSELNQAFRESVTPWGLTDPEKLDEALAKTEAGWTSSQKAYVEENTGYRTTPTLTRYRQAQKQLREYWEVADTVWEEFRQRRPDLQRYKNVDDYGHALWQQLISLGVPSGEAAYRVKQTPTLQAYERLKEARRQVIRAKNPKIDQVLSEFYGYTPLYLQSTGKRPSQPRRRWFETAAASAPW